MANEGADVGEAQRLVDYYRRRILTGLIADGEGLPSVGEMAAKHGVSRASALTVYEALEAQGLAESTPAQMATTRLTDQPYLLSAGGRTPLETDESVREVRLRETPDGVAHELGLSPGAVALLREQLREHQGIVVALSTTWFPDYMASEAPGLLSATPISSSPDGYVKALIGQRGADSAFLQVAARSVDERAGTLLGIQAGSVCLILRSRRFREGRPIEYEELLLSPGIEYAFGYSQRLNNPNLSSDE